MMMNTYEKFEEVLNNNDIASIRSFLDNCILWDGLYKEEIEKYVEELSDKKINGEPIFQADDGMDLSKFKINQDDLDKLSTESMFNFSEKKYRHRLKIANELSKISEKELERKDKVQNKIEVTNEYSNKSKVEIDEKKKIALALGLLMGVGAIVAIMLMKK